MFNNKLRSNFYRSIAIRIINFKPQFDKIFPDKNGQTETTLCTISWFFKLRVHQILKMLWGRLENVEHKPHMCSALVMGTLKYRESKDCFPMMRFFTYGVLRTRRLVH